MKASFKATSSNFYHSKSYYSIKFFRFIIIIVALLHSYSMISFKSATSASYVLPRTYLSWRSRLLQRKWRTTIHYNQVNNQVEEDVRTYRLPSILIPRQQISKVMRSNIVTPYLPGVFQNVFPKPKVVRDVDESLIAHEDNGEMKAIVLDAQLAENASNDSSFVSISTAFPGLPDKISRELEDQYLARPGPSMDVKIPSSWLSLDTLLREALPQSAYPVPSGFEEIGHILHLNLRSMMSIFKNLRELLP